MCYICWSGEDGHSDNSDSDADPDDDDEGYLQRQLGAAVAQMEQRSPPPGSSAASARSKALNPMIRNPCGKCSGSSGSVHLQCLLQWIKSSGSGHCSICNGALPTHFSCATPNIELKVIRHRRGHSPVVFADTTPPVLRAKPTARS